MIQFFFYSWDKLLTDSKLRNTPLLKYYLQVFIKIMIFLMRKVMFYFYFYNLIENYCNYYCFFSFLYMLNMYLIWLLNFFHTDTFVQFILIALLNVHPPHIKILDVYIYVSNIDHNRIALGNEEGLFVVHVTIDGKESLYCSAITLKITISDLFSFIL